MAVFAIGISFLVTDAIFLRMNVGFRWRSCRSGLCDKCDKAGVAFSEYLTLNLVLVISQLYKFDCQRIKRETRELEVEPRSSFVDGTGPAKEIFSLRIPLHWKRLHQIFHR